MSEHLESSPWLSQERFQAAEELFPLVYTELRRLAGQKLAQDQPGQTLQPTALVHEAYLRLRGTAEAALFANQRHFFAAAAEAMRRILVEHARCRKAAKRGGAARQHDVHVLDPAAKEPDENVIALHEALESLTRHDPQTAELVKLRYFLGMSHQEAANMLGIPRRAADRLWVVARTWLYQQLHENLEKI